MMSAWPLSAAWSSGVQRLAFLRMYTTGDDAMTQYDTLGMYCTSLNTVMCDSFKQVY